MTKQGQRLEDWQLDFKINQQMHIYVPINNYKKMRQLIKDKHFKNYNQLINIAIDTFLFDIEEEINNQKTRMD